MIDELVKDLMRREERHGQDPWFWTDDHDEFFYLDEE